MPKKTLESIELALRDYAMTFPEAVEESPWGHRAIKVKKKMFVILGGEKDVKELSMSVKLPASRDMAVDLPFAEPTGYGMGKSGWVSFNPPEDQVPSVEQLKAWVEESYRAQAPRKLVKELDERI